MKRTALVVAIAAVLAASACTPSKDAFPTPEERAICEANCFAKRGTCRASGFDCDRIEANCKRGCPYLE